MPWINQTNGGSYRFFLAEDEATLLGKEHELVEAAKKTYPHRRAQKLLARAQVELGQKRRLQYAPKHR